MERLFLQNLNTILKNVKLNNLILKIILNGNNSQNTIIKRNNNKKHQRERCSPNKKKVKRKNQTLKDLNNIKRKLKRVILIEFDLNQEDYLNLKEINQSINKF